MQKILICICTFNRNKSLIKCLNSVAHLKKINKYNIKILVLDNTRSNNSYKIIQKFKNKTKLKIIHKNEKRRGVVFARNKCIKISKIVKPDYLAFIDDDCIVNKNWIINIFKLLKKKDADVITGPQKYEKLNKIFNKNYASLFEKNYKDKIVKVKWAATNNVFFKYAILKNIKNIDFDRALNKFGIGEDQLFFSLINKAGYKIYWANNIFVTEKIHFHRTNIEWVKKRSLRLGVLGHYIDIKIHGKFGGYLLNYLKSIYFLTLSILNFFNILSNNGSLNSINYFYRFYGKLVGPFKIKKINFFI
jgi:succinoglycan biosynthesis protein ExoM